MAVRGGVRSERGGAGGAPAWRDGGYVCTPLCGGANGAPRPGVRVGGGARYCTVPDNGPRPRGGATDRQGLFRPTPRRVPSPPPFLQPVLPFLFLAVCCRAAPAALVRATGVVVRPDGRRWTRQHPGQADTSY